MVDSHQLWESILFDKGIEEHVVARFVEMAEHMSAEAVKPDATHVVHRLLEDVRDEIRMATYIDSAYGVEEILKEEVSLAIEDLPEPLVEEVTEHVFEELPPEQEDVAEWDVDVN